MMILSIGTHGRSFWILDNITPLRQLTEKLYSVSNIFIQAAEHLSCSLEYIYRHASTAGRSSRRKSPDGAMIDYYLNEKAKDVKLEISISNGDRRSLIRRYTNADTLYKVGDVNIPHYWIRPQQILSSEPVNIDFLWDMKYAPLIYRLLSYFS
jgi:hypothetical protein